MEPWISISFFTVYSHSINEDRIVLKIRILYLLIVGMCMNYSSPVDESRRRGYHISSNTENFLKLTLVSFLFLFWPQHLQVTNMGNYIFLLLRSLILLCFLCGWDRFDMSILKKRKKSLNHSLSSFVFTFLDEKFSTFKLAEKYFSFDVRSDWSSITKNLEFKEKCDFWTHY